MSAPKMEWSRGIGYIWLLVVETLKKLNEYMHVLGQDVGCKLSLYSQKG